MAEESSLPVRERLLAAAAVLFYEQGIAATGIDSITKRAGVAKQSLYNHFASKAELVSAYLQVRHQEWLDLYAKRLQAATTPQAGVLAVFAAYQDHAERAYEHGFRGCGLLNAAAELPVGADGRDIVRAHKEQVEQILHSHLQALFSDRHTVESLARHLAFLLEGAITRSGLEGSSACMQQAAAMAEHLLNSAQRAAS